VDLTLDYKVLDAQLIDYGLSKPIAVIPVFIYVCVYVVTAHIVMHGNDELAVPSSACKWLRMELVRNARKK
jgi:hypothetical protein